MREVEQRLLRTASALRREMDTKADRTAIDHLMETKAGVDDMACKADEAALRELEALVQRSLDNNSSRIQDELTKVGSCRRISTVCWTFCISPLLDACCTFVFVPEQGRERVSALRAMHATFCARQRLYKNTTAPVSERGLKNARLLSEPSLKLPAARGGS